MAILQYEMWYSEVRSCLFNQQQIYYGYYVWYRICTYLVLDIVQNKIFMAVLQCEM